MGHPGFPPVFVVVMGLLCTFVDGLTPRLSFPIGAPGRSLSHFNSLDFYNTTTLLLSDDGDTLLVGARDFILSLDVSKEDIVLKGKLYWAPSEKDMSDCSMKGKKEADCHNYIRVLQFLNSTHMYACGTFAFSPRCTYINSETFSLVPSPSGKPEEGRGRSPYDPYQRNSAIIVDGELYTGTVADYMGNRPVIARHLSVGSHVDLRQEDTLGWLEDPTFISSSFVPSEEKVYFFFREAGREYDFVDKITVSRIAQVCTSDVGGKRTLQRRWTTFAKAQLLCKSDNELPYNILQDMVTLPAPEGNLVDDTLFLGIFSSQWSVNSGQSAVCAFRLGDIKNVFEGNYRALNRDVLRWRTRVQEKVANPGECGLHNASDNTLRFVKENFLAEDSVVPEGRILSLVSPDQRYTHLAVQRVEASNYQMYTVLFLLTETGYLHKAVVAKSGVHITEEVQVFEQPNRIRNILLSISKGVVFVGSSEGVVRVPVSNCSYYWSCAECVLAQDPFCAWDNSKSVCAPTASVQDRENASQDVDRGSVRQACFQAIMPRSRSTESKVEVVSVSLNEVVQLQCPEASRLAQRIWEGPSNPLSPEHYLQPDDGSLQFLAAAAVAEDQYRCVAIENGHRQTLVVYQLRLRSSPTSREAPLSPTDLSSAVAVPKQASWNLTNFVERKGENGAESRGEEALLLERGRTYLKELVAVSVLLTGCVLLLTAIALYHARRRCSNKTAPQDGSPGRDSERGAPHEQEPLHDDQLPPGNGKHNGQANGVTVGRTPKGSNGHLPNTPT